MSFLTAPMTDPLLNFTRRALLGRTSAGIGSAALASLLAPHAFGAASANVARTQAAPAPSPMLGLPGFPHFPAKAKRVIYLFQSGGPSQMDLFDPKPQLGAFYDNDLPDSVR